MSRSTRRAFLGQTAAAATAAALASCQLQGRRPPPKAPKDSPLALGVIGVGGRGWDNLHAVAPGETIAALCDVDANHLAAAAQAFPGAARFRDWREMLRALPLDAVVISTPDHTHAPATLAALEAGLDVYCEKPLTHTIAEAREVATRAEWHRAVTQMGTQIHAEPNYRRVVEHVRAGVIGEVREAHCWVGKAWGGGERPADTPPVPAHLDWELWIGTAPWRPYHSAYHPAGWRRWWDFGTGTLGDMGCHHLDLPFWALELRRPEAAVAEGPPPHEETAPLQMRARWEFASRRAHDGTRLPPVTMWWHDGGLRPPQFAEEILPDWGDGTLFVGSEGMLLADYGRFVLLPEAKFAALPSVERSIPDSVGHHKEWLDACRTRGRTTCSFDYAGPLTETVLMGVEAYRALRA